MLSCISVHPGKWDVALGSACGVHLPFSRSRDLAYSSSFPVCVRSPQWMARSALGRGRLKAEPGVLEREAQCVSERIRIRVFTVDLVAIFAEICMCLKMMGGLLKLKSIHIHTRLAPESSRSGSPRERARERVSKGNFAPNLASSLHRRRCTQLKATMFVHEQECSRIKRY